MHTLAQAEIAAIIEKYAHTIRPKPDSSAETKEPPPARVLDTWANLQPVDVSRRAIQIETIMAIANFHGWQIAITHFLQTRGKPYLSDLTDPQLDDLLDRMHGYVDAAETGASLEYQPPA